MAKGLDGIKKLSPDELKKYRQVVLNYIGEKDKAEIKEFSKQPASALKKVDGLKSKASQVIEKNIDPEKSRQKEERGRLKEAILRQEEERRKIKQEEELHKIKQGEAEKERRRQEQEKINLEKETVRQAKIAETEKIKQQQEQTAKERREKEELIKQEKLKRHEEERLKKELALKVKREAEERAKEEKRQKKEQAKKERQEKKEKIKQQKEQAEKERREKEELIKQEKLKRLEEERQKKEIALKAKREAEEQAKAEAARRKQEKIRLKEKAKEEKRRFKENLRLETIKRREEKKRIKHEIWLSKQQAAAKRKIKRQKAYKKFKNNFKIKLNKLLTAVKKNFAYGLMLLIIFLAVGYLIFCLAVLRFKINNSFLPVPAVVSNRGIISYQDFINLNDGNYLSGGYQMKKDYLAKWLILRNLKLKYGLKADAPDEKVAEKFLADEDFNQVGLSRVKKISELLTTAEIEKLNKYADEYNDGIYLSAEAAMEKFGPAAMALAIGQTSGIILHDGYYLIKRIDDKNGQSGFKYLLVGANTLGQYLHGKLGKIIVFILAN